MAIVTASSHLSDEDFLVGFEHCELPLSNFRHGDHLRLAWLCVHRAPVNDAVERVRNGIRRFATHHGVAHIFHETITAAWVKLISTHREQSFGEFVTTNESRLNLELLHRFWTPEVLRSDAARLGWVAPDKTPLPD
jgi:hypothetical protein